MYYKNVREDLTLQRHFSTLTKFAHVESRFFGRKQQGKVVFYASVTFCVALRHH